MAQWQEIDVVDDGSSLVFRLPSVPTEREFLSLDMTPLPDAPGGAFRLRHSQRRTSGASYQGAPMGPPSPFPLGPADERATVIRIEARISNSPLPNQEAGTERLVIQVGRLWYADGEEGHVDVYPRELERVQ